MRLQRNATGATARFTPDDLLALSRELGYLADDNALIFGGKLEALRLEIEETHREAMGESRGTIDRNSPECNYGAF